MADPEQLRILKEEGGRAWDQWRGQSRVRPLLLLLGRRREKLLPRSTAVQEVSETMANLKEEPLPKDWREMHIVKVRANNPRRHPSHGWYSWESYRDGMTGQEYLDQPYDAKSMPINQGKNHHHYTGPHHRHLQWDVNRGWIRLLTKEQYKPT